MFIVDRRFCQPARLLVIFAALAVLPLGAEPPEAPAEKAEAPHPAPVVAAENRESAAASGASTPASAPRLSADEAASRARLLHSALHGALQVMHRDFFRRGDSKIIPSGALVDVFKSIEQEWGVALRWLAPDETIMNDEHAPRDEFERRALKALAGREKELVAEEKDVLRYAGAVVLQNDCLKCHIPNRKSLEDRFSALSITIPLAPPAAR